jgi:2-hydroxy-3-oxopropionate reductase
MRIAFIGLGVMGLPMARNLVAAGQEVIGYNRSPAKIDLLVEAGGAGAASVADAVRDAEVVITILPDSPDVLDVYTGAEGVLENVSAGALLIDMSSIRPDVAVQIHELAAARSLPTLDAPVSGGQKGAEDGVLSIMVGGSSDDFDRARPIFEILGSTIVLVGGAGAGQTVKAANQLLVAGTIQLVAEAMVFLDAHSVELAPAIEVLNGGLAGNAILTRKGASMLAGNFAPGFRVDLHYKDLNIYQDASRAAGIFSPLGALMGQLMSSLRATGGGQLDHSALLKQADELSGRSTWGRKNDGGVEHVEV